MDWTMPKRRETESQNTHTSPKPTNERVVYTSGDKRVTPSAMRRGFVGVIVEVSPQSSRKVFTVVTRVSWMISSDNEFIVI